MLSQVNSNLSRIISVMVWSTLIYGFGCAADAQTPLNLLINPQFDYYPLELAREGKWDVYQSSCVAGWEQDAYGDAVAYRSGFNGYFTPRHYAENVLKIQPGKRCFQFMLLPDIQVVHGDQVSLSVFGYQIKPGQLKATIYLMQLDSGNGTWSPSEYGFQDARTFAKHARGHLIKKVAASVVSDTNRHFEVKIENVEVPGSFSIMQTNSIPMTNTVALLVEFANMNESGDLWIYSPCLFQSTHGLSRLPVLRSLPTLYRYIPRTMTKLLRGEAIHILVAGASGDRGDANPPMYLYDENMESPTFKQPLSEQSFDGKLIGHPEWDEYISTWSIYFSYGGQLRLALMRKFNLPIDKILLNYMATGGTMIWESHSQFDDFAALKVQPTMSGVGNGVTNKTWQQLHPEIINRPEGPGPDLVVFGGCQITEKQDEGAVEGAVRWFQRHYPQAEILFQIQNLRTGISGAPGILTEIALQYQIPYIDAGRIMNLLERYGNPYAFIPWENHPQAAAHYVYAKLLAQAFEITGNVLPGIAQRHLPPRITPEAIAWEGDITTYAAPSPRFYQGRLFVMDDSVANIWADQLNLVVMDGVTNTYSYKSQGMRLTSSTRRDICNSSFATRGSPAIGERHVIEVIGTNANVRLVAVDCKIIPTRTWLGVKNQDWKLNQNKVKSFPSLMGAPDGINCVNLLPGASMEVDVFGTDLAVAYADDPQGGRLEIAIDDQPGLIVDANQPYIDTQGNKLYIENRRGIRGLEYKRHHVVLRTLDKPVSILGIYVYDTRSASY